MELLTEELRKQLPPLYSQENVKDPMVICKFFHPLSNMTWYAIEGEPSGDDFLFFGYGHLFWFVHSSTLCRSTVIGGDCRVVREALDTKWSVTPF